MSLIPTQLTAIFPPESLAAVGGAVRDELLHRHDSRDVDLATILPPEDAANLLQAAHIPHDKTHMEYGTLTAHVPKGLVEITSTRTESYKPGNRFPKTHFGATWAEDATRRDFTFNAIYLFPDGRTYDPLGGVKDLQEGRVRFIINPATSLERDPLRLYRFARFCGIYGLTGWSGEVDKALREAAPAAHKLSKTKVAEEMAKIRKTPHAAAVLQRLKILGL